MSRRANGEGSWSVREGPHGKTYELRVVIDGKRRSFSGKSKPECRRKAKEAENAPKIDKKMTVAEWATVWLKTYRESNISHVRYLTQKGHINNHIVPHLGAMQMGNVRPAHIQEFLRIHADKSWHMRQAIRSTLRIMFADGIENKLCTENPAIPVKLGPQPKRRPKAFARDVIPHILDFIPQHPYDHYVALLLYTGLRSGELLALKWPDIHDGIVEVHAAVARVKGGSEEKNTKNEDDRCIGLHPELASILNSMPKEGLYVIPSNSGGRLPYQTFHFRYKKFFADMPPDLRVPYLSPHKCRHTFATYMLDGNVSLRGVQDALGHRNINTTQIYTSIDRVSAKSNIARLDYGRKTGEAKEQKT
ncbi:MAG: tyrosine-type recombinase/integrase [Oscillospiraceae bacterium]|jgi:integrase|nr:tyrosine-type recombinase/integrase [Oscillospiraceae bacterium]